MKVFSILLVFTLITSARGGEWVVPWVAHRDGQWASQVVINNQGDSEESFRLEAVRADGSRQIVENMQVEAASQRVLNPGQIFDQLGSGAGYSIFISSESQTWSAAVRVASTNTASGFSPASAAGTPLEQSADRLLFPLLPADGFAAPVIVNLENTTVTIALSAFTESGPHGEPIVITIPPRTPFTQLMQGDGGLFSTLNESAYLLVEADGAVAGAGFYFNDFLEPAMINALSQVEVDSTLVAPLLSTLETAGTVTGAFDTSVGSLINKAGKREDCPQIDIDISITNPESLIQARFDWGAGCTNRFGVFHAGAADLNFQRQGNLASGSMEGRLEFDQFLTKYLGSTVNIDGSTHFQGSTNSKNFSWSGHWQMNAGAAVYGAASSLNADVAIIINENGGNLEGSGQIKIQIDSVYNSDIFAAVDAADPLIYNLETCIWPTDGRLNFDIYYAGYRYSGYIDFGTGNCNTAEVSLRGVQTELYLPGLYP